MSSRDLYNNVGLNDEPSLEAKRRLLAMHLSHLDMDALSLAKRLLYLGDLRPIDTIDRNVHQMLLGNMEVPGDLVMLVDMLSRQLMRVKRTGNRFKWKLMDGDIHQTEVQGFKLRLISKSAGRYKIHLENEGKRCKPCWPVWKGPLDAAKVVALLCLDDALSLLDKREAPTLMD